MIPIFQLSDLQFKEHQVEPSEYRLQSVLPRLSEIAGSKDLSFTIRRLCPGKYSFPYHFHYNSEELFIILQGEASLRTPEGIRIVRQGDVIFFPKGAEGAHQMFNHSDADCTYFDLGTQHGQDVTEYPDSGKVALLPQFVVFRKEDQCQYFDGEREPAKFWKQEGE